MEGLKPGRIVYFVFSEADAENLSRQRAGGAGNAVKDGDVYPAMVVRVWDGASGCCNLKVMLDGPDTFWATSVSFNESKQPRSWHWMFDGQQKRYDPTVPK